MKSMFISIPPKTPSPSTGMDELVPPKTPSPIEIPEEIQEELIEEDFELTVERKIFKDYKMKQIDMQLREYMYRSLVLDLKEDINSIIYANHDEIAASCMNFLKKYKEIHDEYKRINQYKKSHCLLSKNDEEKKPKKSN